MHSSLLSCKIMGQHRGCIRLMGFYRALQTMKHGHTYAQDGLISMIPCWIWPVWISVGCKRKHCDEMRKMHYICMVRHNTSSQWQNMRIMILNHWQLDCLFNSLLGLTVKWMSKFHLNILLWGETAEPGEKGPKKWGRHFRNFISS